MGGQSFSFLASGVYFLLSLTTYSPAPDNWGPACLEAELWVIYRGRIRGVYGGGAESDLAKDGRGRFDCLWGGGLRLCVKLMYVYSFVITLRPSLVGEVLGLLSTILDTHFPFLQARNISPPHTRARLVRRTCVCCPDCCCGIHYVHSAWKCCLVLFSPSSVTSMKTNAFSARLPTNPPPHLPPFSPIIRPPA